jgi:catechol 2,3-dioxygenase-like lactoylglutathione lyase family enzyme
MIARRSALEETVILRAIPVLHITDAAKAEAFYCGLLGFRLDFCAAVAEPRRDPCYMGVSRDDAVLHLSSHAGDGVIGGVALLKCDDVDALHAEFASRRVAIATGPVNQTWGMRELYVRDPDGNSIRFAAPLKGAV